MPIRNYPFSIASPGDIRKMDLSGKVEVKKQDPICTFVFYPKNQNSYHLLDLTKGKTA